MCAAALTWQCKQASAATTLPLFSHSHRAFKQLPLCVQVFGVSTLASVTPAQPFVFRNYELPREADELARSIRASMGSSRYYVWQVGDKRGAWGSAHWQCWAL
jgi:hypothetical protein